MIFKWAETTRFGQAVWMILAMTFAAITTIFAKSLTEDLHVLEIVWMRLFLGCIFIWPFYRSIAKRNLPKLGLLHLLRAVILIGMTGLWFLALQLGPVAQAAAMSYTYPVFVLVFAAIFFGARIKRVDVLSLVLSFIGVALIFQLGTEQGEWQFKDMMQMLAVLASSVLIAIRVSVEKVMSVDLEPEDILLGSMLIATVLVLPSIIPIWITPTLKQVLNMLALTVTATLSQLFVIQLVRSGAWSIVSIFAFWEVLAAIVLGVLIFSESLPLIGVIGAGLIVAGGLTQVGRQE